MWKVRFSKGSPITTFSISPIASTIPKAFHPCKSPLSHLPCMNRTMNTQYSNSSIVIYEHSVTQGFIASKNVCFMQRLKRRLTIKVASTLDEGYRWVIDVHSGRKNYVTVLGLYCHVNCNCRWLPSFFNFLVGFSRTLEMGFWVAFCLNAR